MKAVITGSSGFIGSRLVEVLHGQGWELRLLVRPSSRPLPDAPPAQRVGIDFSRPETLEACEALHDADIVFHVAGVTKALTIDDFRAGNVAPTRHLVDALKRVNPGLQRFVLVSSQAAAGPAGSAEVPMRESMPSRPLEDYGRSKWEAEALLGEDTPFPYTVIRPAAVYGPRDVDFFELFKQLRLGLGIYPGNKHSLVSTIHVDDLVEGIRMAAVSPAAVNQTYYLTHEVAVAWPDIYQAIADAWGRNFREIHVPFGAVAFAGRLGDVFSKLTGRITVLNSNKIELARPRYWICSPQKAMTEFGFTPRIPIDQGLKATLTWYKDAGWM